MSSTLDLTPIEQVAPSRLEGLLQQRLTMTEDLLEEVLRDECGQELVDLLWQLRAMCSPEGQAPRAVEADVLKIVAKLQLDEAIRAARAFALYFQLINIVEQHYEQEDSIIRTRGIPAAGLSRSMGIVTHLLIARPAPRLTLWHYNKARAPRFPHRMVYTRRPFKRRMWELFLGCFRSSNS